MVETPRARPATHRRTRTFASRRATGSIPTTTAGRFRDIWTNDEETLGDAVVARDEFWVYPDSRTGRQFERNPDANYIVGVAIVRRPAGVSWRTILELPPPAAEAQCAALQENPEAAPEEEPNVHLAFELDDYQIEGGVRLEYPPPPCADDDPICQAERAAREAAEGAAPEAPEVPEVPEVPQAPAPPSAPTAPSVPAP